MTWGSIRRVLRKEGYSFRRARRVPPKSPPAGHQDRVKRALARFHRLEEAGKCQVLYTDESGFCLSPPLPCPSVLVLDNATVHRSKLVQARRWEWKEKGLRLLFLPPYCPHLNLIEMLWRQIKYRWLAPEAYKDFHTLCKSVTDVLAQVGTKYRITFA